MFTESPVVALCAVLPLSTLLGTLVIPSPLALTGTLVLRNTRWDRVQIEVRVGASTSCAENPLVGAHPLGRDESWGIVTTDVICWRRELVPGDPAKLWTPWGQVQLARAEVRNVTL